MNNEIYRNNRCAFLWRCPLKYRKQLKEEAAKKGISMSDLLNQAWKEFYNSLKK